MPVKLYGILEWRFQLLFRLQQDRLLQRKGIRTATDHHRNDWNVRLESHSMRFLTARQERTEVVTRAGLVFSIYDREGVFFIKEKLQQFRKKCNFPMPDITYFTSNQHRS